MALPPRESDVAPRRRRFTNRHDLIAAFQDAYAASTLDRLTILNFHGKGGIGKTWLLEWLRDEHTQEGDAVAYHDLGLSTDARDPAAVLVRLRTELERTGGVLFPTFDLAFAHYWGLRSPHLSLRESALRGTETGSMVIDVASSAGVPLVGLIKTVPKLLDKLGRMRSGWDAHGWWNSRGRDLLARVQAITRTEDAHLVEPLLRTALGDDLRAWLADEAGRRAVLLFDTHETFWHVREASVGREDPDAWVRDLAANLQGAVVVVAGRNPLAWDMVHPAWAEIVQDRSVEDFEMRYIEEYLTASGVAEADVREAIAERSNGVPLYLFLAVRTYERIRQAETRAPQPDEFDENLTALFKRFLRYSDPSEKAALLVLSVPESFDRDRYERLLTAFNTGYPATASGLAALASLDFVREPQPGTYTLHDLVRDALASQHDPEERQRVDRLLYDDALSALEDVDPKAITDDHRQALSDVVAHGPESGDAETFLSSYWEVEQPFYHAHDWRTLQALRGTILDFAERVLGPDHPGTLAFSNSLGSLYLSQGDYVKAESLLIHALEGYGRVLGPDHTDTIASVNDLGCLYRSQGDYAKAEPLLVRALEGCERVLGPDHPSTIASVNNLGELYRSQGDYAKAEPLLVRALEGCERVLGPDHPNTPRSINNLGELYRSQGDYAKAEPLLVRALEGCERVLGPDHPSTLSSVGNLGELYRSRGDYTMAEPFYVRALEGCERVLGPDHPGTLTSVNNLGGLYWSQGDYARSESLFALALERCERCLGLDHTTTRITRHNLEACRQRL